MRRISYVNPAGTGSAQGSTHTPTKSPPVRLTSVRGSYSAPLDSAIVTANDVEASFRRVLANLAGVPAGLGLGVPNGVKFTTLFNREQDIETFMGLRGRHFPEWFGGDAFPPNTIMVVRRLVKPEFLFEVEAVASAG